MSAKHTPGPWYVGADGTIIYAKDGFAVASASTFHGRHGGRNEAKACASLIAATPDLLEALQSVFTWLESQADNQSKGGHATFDLIMLREQRDIARAAITKAIG